ncbi:hypothetical protein C1Y63_02120 [Corynebacterium sp. 13CS0277]|uniref:hypothetical protein n=1 Tax=Corynebacterium sp. 13CS0277 TaxID=2071994 RepID=UPI000D037FF3|nr:hypothetical protein [Corynebacterium sp. 13CS0277]PRQ12132.1 hypothetical protein C1Y63_02120 [Corynebacterium sp. 13CS0277]
MPAPAHEFTTRSLWLSAALLTAATTTVTLGVLALLGTQTGHSLTWALSRWDAQYYMGIAEGGYFDPTSPVIDGPPWERTLAFFPALPAILRVFHLAGISTLAAGVVVSQLFAVVACAGMMRLADKLNLNPFLAGTLLLGAPLAVTLTMPYSEALFLALALWAVVFILEDKFFAAGLLCLVAGLVRLTAVDLIAVLVLVVTTRLLILPRLRAGREMRATEPAAGENTPSDATTPAAATPVTTRGARLRAWAATPLASWLGVLLAPLGLAGYLLYANRQLVDAGGYFGIQKDGWHSAFDFGQATVRFLHRVTTDPEADIGYFLSAAIMILIVVAVIASWRRLPWPVWLFGAAIAANVLLSDGIMHSRPRLLLPAYVLLLPLVGVMQRATGRTQLAVACGYLVCGAWISAYFLMVFPWAI